MGQLQALELATYCLIAVNFVTFAAFGYDKMQAENGGWRVAEATLAFLVLLGGIIGALAGRSLFRHKTRKNLFHGENVERGSGQSLSDWSAGGMGDPDFA